MSKHSRFLYCQSSCADYFPPEEAVSFYFLTCYCLNGTFYFSIIFPLEGLTVVYIVYDHLTCLLGTFRVLRIWGSLVMDSFCAVVFVNAACCSGVLGIRSNKLSSMGLAVQRFQESYLIH